MIRNLLSLLHSSFVAVDEVPRYRICDNYADVPVINQFNEQHRFQQRFVSDGGALLINTMYTTCRGSCPGTSNTLQKLRETLSPVFGDRLSMISLSIDPYVDTPTKLRKYAARFGADRDRERLCRWDFLTGEAENVDTLRRSLGFYDLDPRIDRDPTQHASTLLFGNSTSDRWATLPAEMPMSTLVSTIRRIAGFTFEQKYAVRP